MLFRSVRHVVESPYANDDRRHRRPSVFVRPEEGFDPYAGRVLPRPIINPDFHALAAGGERYSFFFKSSVENFTYVKKRYIFLTNFSLMLLQRKRSFWRFQH
mgnify:FL=1